MAKHITMTNEFKAAFDSFMQKLQEMKDAYMREHGYNWKETFTYDEGAKYIRVVNNTGHGSRSSHCFVEKNTGAIFKCESWKKPAKWSRGNIFAAEQLSGVGVHGADYLR